MLVLSRKKDQEIIICVPGREQPITIMCVDVWGDRTRLGVHADQDITIHRREVQEQINQRDPENATPLQDRDKRDAVDTVRAECGVATPKHGEPTYSVDPIPPDRT